MSRCLDVWKRKTSYRRIARILVRAGEVEDTHREKRSRKRFPLSNRKRLSSKSGARVPSRRLKQQKHVENAKICCTPRASSLSLRARFRSCQRPRAKKSDKLHARRIAKTSVLRVYRPGLLSQRRLTPHICRRKSLYFLAPGTVHFHTRPSLFISAMARQIAARIATRANDGEAEGGGGRGDRKKNSAVHGSSREVGGITGAIERTAKRAQKCARER